MEVSTFFLGASFRAFVHVSDFSSMDGLDTMLENGPWFIRNNPLILKKYNPDVNLLKEDVGNVSVWVKLHGVPMTAFSEDGLSAIVTKLALIAVRADVELKDNIVMAMPKLVGEGFYTCIVRVEYKWKSPRQVSKKNNVNTSGNKKKYAEPTIKASNSNPFDVLNSVENDIDLGTNGWTLNLASKKANSSGFLFWNVESSSTNTTPIVEKINKIERLIIDGKVTLVDDEGKPLAKVDSSGDHDSEDEESYENDDYNIDLYDDDMYEGQDIPDKIQAICDNLNIKVRGKLVLVEDDGIPLKPLNVGGQTIHMDHFPYLSNIFGTKKTTTKVATDKFANFHTIVPPIGNGADVFISIESVLEVKEHFENFVYEFFLTKELLIYSNTGIESFIENGPWLIRNVPLILRKLLDDVKVGNSKDDNLDNKDNDRENDVE
ncbi:reverse transcriptase domain-containing protein [Tanacetum coccineum]